MEKSVFTALCLYTLSRSDEERKALGKDLIQLIRRASVQDELTQHQEMLMNPVTIIIRTLLTFKDLEKTEQNLAAILGVPVSLVVESLELLSKLGLIVPSKDGAYTSTHKNLKIPDNLQHGDGRFLSKKLSAGD